MKAEWTNKDVLTQSETTGLNSKTVLVIDTPNNCSECPCCYVLENDWGDFISARCQMKYKGFVDKYSEYNKGRPSWCPLNPLPERSEIKQTDDEYMKHYKQGVNDTLARIEGKLMQAFSED